MTESSFDSLAPFAGKYQVVRVLGQGGMGTVFEGRHIRTGHRVAIKVLGSSLVHHPDLVKRFEREARACGALTSANAVKVHDIDTTHEGTPYIVMELLAGTDLAGVLTREGAQSVGRSTRWLLDACEAIAEAHTLGIVHRDVKPSNIFVADIEGVPVVKVLDFGIAKMKAADSTESTLTHATCPLGTPQYMSPEQVRCAKDVDARTDVWSLGVTLYELVTGRTPYQDAEESWAVIAAVAADPIPDPRVFRPDLSDEFIAVMMKALEKNADDRYESVEAFASAIAPFADAGPVARARSTASYSETLPAPRPSDASFPALSSIAAEESSARTHVKKNRRIAVLAAAAIGILALVIPSLTSSAARASVATVATLPRMNFPVVVPPPVVAPPPVQVAEVVEEKSVEDLPKQIVMARPAAIQQPAMTRARTLSAQSTPSTKRPHGVDLTVHGGLSGPGL